MCSTYGTRAGYQMLKFQAPPANATATRYNVYFRIRLKLLTGNHVELSSQSQKKNRVRLELEFPPLLLH